MKTFKEFVENSLFNEEKVKSLTVTFGRFNPPTSGHEKVFKKVAQVAKGGDYRIYASQSFDPKRNPLKYDDKIKFLRKMFPKFARNIHHNVKVKTLLDVAAIATTEGYTQFNVIVGSDRIKEFETLLNKYNLEDHVPGKGFYFPEGIKVVSSGDRDPDSDKVDGMSASKLRAAAADNDLELFSKGMPKSYKGAKDLLNAVRAGMGLKESTNFRKHLVVNTDERRERYIAGEIFNVGENVINVKTNKLYAITERHNNFVTVIDADNKKHKFFIHDITQAPDPNEN